MDKSTSFLSEKEALAIPPPSTKTHVEHWHQIDSFFGIRVMRPKAKTGKVTRSWLVGWYEGAHHRRKVLGRVDSTSWHAARRRAFEHIDKVRSNQIVGATPTFGQAYELYVARKSHKWAPDTLLNYNKSVAYLLPLWESKRADTITEQDCAQTYAAIKNLVTRNSAGKALQRDGTATATSAMRLAKAVFADLVRRRKISGNPCLALNEDGVFDRSESKARMIPAEQLPTFWRWIHTHPLPAVRDYILMGLLMALRQSVLGSLRWSNLVQADGVFHYVLRPDQRGNKRRAEIPMPIPTYLVDTVIKPRLSSPTKHPVWIIESPKHRDQPLRSVRGTYETLSAQTGIKISDHDMRRTIATLTTMLCGEILAKRILTHSVQATAERHATTSGYVITGKDDLLDGMNKVVGYILNVVEKSTQEVGDSRKHDLETRPMA